MHGSSGDGEKWADSRNTLKVELTGLADGEDAGSEKEPRMSPVLLDEWDCHLLRRLEKKIWAGVDEDRNSVLDMLRLRGLTSHWCSGVK